jgi:hypothetical protein
MPARHTRLVGVTVLGVALVAAIAFTVAFPAVEGIGTRVRLPVFHGALTWVNLAAFSLMGIAAIVALVTRSDRAYRWEEALRWIAVPMWIVGSGLGYLAAINTWDFTASKTSRASLVMADPRLMAQFWILLAGLALLALGLMIDDRRWLSVLDVGFVGLMWVVIMRAVLGPGRALHPDSPVLNSDELRIKLLFLGIVAALGVATLAAAWLVSKRRGRSI